MTISEKTKEILRKQHYEVVGEHSGVQVCRWTKKAICGEGGCYKQKFYGIESHRCCQMSPCLYCDNQCMHCWRAIKYFNIKDSGEIKWNTPKEIIDGCIEAQRKLLTGFKIDEDSEKEQLSKADMEKWKEAQEPMQFAISLSGEPTIYPYIGELIEELRKRGKTSFLVTNGLHPEKLKELIDKKQLPTQLYVSVNAGNKKDYDEFHRSCVEGAWEKLNESLELMNKFPRSVFRINLVRGINMSDEDVEEFGELIKKAEPMFVEVKGFMSVGFARERLGYDKMPSFEEMKSFVEKLSKETGLKILDNHEFSRAWVLGESEENLKINQNI